MFYFSVAKFNFYVQYPINDPEKVVCKTVCMFQGSSSPSAMVRDFSSDSNFLSGSPLSLYSPNPVSQGSGSQQPAQGKMNIIIT
jgi:hypothetical protein